MDPDAQQKKPEEAVENSSATNSSANRNQKNAGETQKSPRVVNLPPKKLTNGQASDGENRLMFEATLCRCPASDQYPKPEDQDNAEKMIRRQMDEKQKREGEVDLDEYEELWRAVRDEDWEDVKTQLDKHPDALTSPITEFYETMLHILVKWKKALWLVKEIVQKIDARGLGKTDYRGDTALSVAASVGNTEAAELMANKKPALLMKDNSGKETPFHFAAKFGHEKTFYRLLYVAKNKLKDKIEQFFSNKGVKLVECLLSGNLYGLTLDLLESYPTLLGDHSKLNRRKKILEELAKKPLAFESGYNFRPWERLIYKAISVTEKDPSTQTPPLKDPPTIVRCATQVDQRINQYETLDTVAGNLKKDCNINNHSIQTQSDGCLRINISNSEYLNPIPTSEDEIEDEVEDEIEDEIKSSKLVNFFQYCRQKAVSIFRSNLPTPRLRKIYETKKKNEQARRIVKILCEGVKWNFRIASETLKGPALSAASLGVAEIIEEILRVYPAAASFYDDKNRTILQLAVLHRREKVFNLFLRRCLSQKWLPIHAMKDKENVLHLAGRCVPSIRINGAALQMQLEMQWFTAVERMVHPLLLEERNSDNKTPREVFEDEHKKLIEDGEKWMRDTASSCMVVDALIIAMVFAAIIAVPGNNEKGIPNFRFETLFKVFIIADAAALFSSSFSLLLFVRILASRYAEEDFLKVLPTKLLLGLMTLIFSVGAMLVASSSALMMLIDAVPGPKVLVRMSTLIPVTILTALPFLFFIWSQSHLLVDVLLSTYKPPVFFLKEDDE